MLACLVVLIVVLLIMVVLIMVLLVIRTVLIMVMLVIMVALLAVVGGTRSEVGDDRGRRRRGGAEAGGDAHPVQGGPGQRETGPPVQVGAQARHQVAVPDLVLRQRPAPPGEVAAHHLDPQIGRAHV